MAGMAIALLFLLMVAAPCMVALRNSRLIADTNEAEAEEPEIPAVASTPVSRWATADALQTLAVEAEVEALLAKERADRAHWAALTAAARAAALRADAASQAAEAASLAADRALWAAEYEGQYLPENHPSLDFPRSPVRRRAA